jgi:hypothetical protein
MRWQLAMSQSKANLKRQSKPRINTDECSLKTNLHSSSLHREISRRFREAKTVTTKGQEKIRAHPRNPR